MEVAKVTSLRYLMCLDNNFTFCSNWGFRIDEGRLQSCSSFNDQDDPVISFNIDIVPNANVFNSLSNAHCYILTITSDYALASVPSIINYLWEREKVPCYAELASTSADSGDKYHADSMCHGFPKHSRRVLERATEQQS